MIGECCDRVWLHPEGVVSLLVGEEIGSFLRELDAVHVILRGLEGILQFLGHVAEKLVSVLEAEHAGVVGQVSGPQLSVSLDAFLDPVVHIRAGRGDVVGGDGNPVSVVVERHGGDGLFGLVPLAELALQFRRDVGPLAAVLSYEDEPFAVLGSCTSSM